MAGGGACGSRFAARVVWLPLVSNACAAALRGKPASAAHSAAKRAMLEPRKDSGFRMVRRLTVLQNDETDDALAARRPRWQWILIGAGFVITLFLPLAQVGVWLGQRLSQAAVPSDRVALRIGLGALPVALSFLIACGGAGALVGRFGGRAKAREAALSGALGAFVGWGLAALGGALSPWLVAVTTFFALVVFGAGAAFIGARLGLSRRL